MRWRSSDIHYVQLLGTQFGKLVGYCSSHSHCSRAESRFFQLSLEMLQASLSAKATMSASLCIRLKLDDEDFVE